MIVRIETGMSVVVGIGPHDRSLTTFASRTVEMLIFEHRVVIDLSDDRRITVFDDRWAINEIGLSVSETMERHPDWPAGPPSVIQDDKVDVAVSKVYRDADHIAKMAADLDRPPIWRRFVDWLDNK